MKIKSRLRLEIKEVTAEGSFEGLLSPYGNVDQGGDVVECGAYTKTLQERGNTVPMLWQHSTKDPVGLLTLEDRSDGLWCKGQLLMDDPLAQRAYRFIKAGVVKGLSIGFEAIKDSVVNGVRTLKEIRLYEGSIVTFPMNESALITAVKGHGETKGDFNEELTEIQLGDAGYQMRSALSYALSSIIWADLGREEKIAGAELIIQQFHDAYMEYLPTYLDMLTETYGGMETWSKRTIEIKAGRMISAANKETIKSACDHMMSAHTLMSALVDDEAGADDATTSGSKAAAAKPEPVSDHSATVAEALKTLKKETVWNFSSN